MPCVVVPLLAAAALAVTAAPPLRIEVVAKDRVMTGLYKVYGSPREFPDQWLAAVVCSNQGKEKVRELQVRFRIADHVAWNEWSHPRDCAPGQELAVPYHPLFDGDIVNLQSSTPVQLDVEWKYRGASGWVVGDATQRITLLGGREFIFSSVAAGNRTFEEAFSNAPFLAAWVSRDDPVIKQYASLVSRRAGGVAAIQGIEGGLETLRASYELMLLNDFVYKSPVGLHDNRLSFDSKLVQNLKYPRDVLRDKSGTCIELAILHAAIAHQLGIDCKLALVRAHCFPIFQLEERGDDKKVKILRVPLEATGIRGGLRGSGVTRVGFDAAVEMARATEEAAKESGDFIEVDVAVEWGRGVSSPELPPLPSDILERWGILLQGVPGMTLPELGSGPAKEDRSGFGGRWEGTVEGRFGEPEKASYRATLGITVLRGARYRIAATFVPEDGGPTIQEDLVGEDQDGQLVFQGTKRAKRLGEGKVSELAPGRGAATVKDGRLVGKYGADGEGFSAFSLERQ